MSKLVLPFDLGGFASVLFVFNETTQSLKLFQAFQLFQVFQVFQLFQVFQ